MNFKQKNIRYSWNVLDEKIGNRKKMLFLNVNQNKYHKPQSQFIIIENSGISIHWNFQLHEMFSKTPFCNFFEINTDNPSFFFVGH